MSVISFGGNQWICIFTDISTHSNEIQARHSLLELCCASAVQCSLQLVDLHTELLTTQVGVTCGDLQFTSLGGYQNEWTFVLTGQLWSCVDDATSCQVCVSSDVYMNLSKVFEAHQLNATPTELNNYIIKSMVEESKFIPHIKLPNRFESMVKEAPVLKLMKNFVPRPILHAIMNGTLDIISELRTVTTVFLKLDSYCPVKNADPITLQPLFVRVQKALNEAGGFLQQFSIDDKGCVLIAMWGVPSCTFENNKARAVSFSLAIHKDIAELGHKCSIGVTTGKVFCGKVGCSQRRVYVGIGAKVNLAARLMFKSKGGIFIDVETAASNGDDTSLLPDNAKPETIQIKGESAAQAYHLTGEETHSSQKHLEILQQQSFSKAPYIRCMYFRSATCKA